MTLEASEVDELVKDAFRLRERWLDAALTDAGYAQGRAALRERGRPLLRADVATAPPATRRLRERFLQTFDDSGQVGCVIEWLRASRVGGDDAATVRRYATDAWEEYFADADGGRDRFRLLPDQRAFPE